MALPAYKVKSVGARNQYRFQHGRGMRHVTDASGSISRRRFGQMAGGALASAIVSPVACALDTSALQNFEGRLSVRTKAGVRTTASGTQRLGLDPGRGTRFCTCRR